MISGDPMAKDIVTYVACAAQDLRMRPPRMWVVRNVEQKITKFTDLCNQHLSFGASDPGPCWRSTLGPLPEVFCGGRRWVGGYRAESKSQPKNHRGLWSHFQLKKLSFVVDFLSEMKWNE